MSEKILDWRNEGTIPKMNPIEKGLRFVPQYETENPEIEINTAEWTHICSCRFGEARICNPARPATKWTGNSFRYDIFYRAEVRGCIYPQFALRWSHGGGDGWLLSDAKGHDEENQLVRIAHIPEETRRWDACHFLAEIVEHIIHSTARATARQYAEAFVEGRLKKHRRKGTYHVEITPKVLRVLRATEIPADWPVQPLKPGEPAEVKATCGHCGLSWDDGKITSMTPAPLARCPFEQFHH